ncbi:uncharacterized protein LOC113168211 [Anabas testudineus]|uniref:Uncharacterized protein n=1 Tax=Anabas testudineus TaxID=64144 RepID=A0A7N6F847_ANATE|nr:uncharacterized protein LOC113168211 [Anabas testudineus]
MTKPKIKECLFCQTMNRINLKTCSAGLSHLDVKQSLKKKHNDLINTSWAASVKKHCNSSRIVNSAQNSISKLNVLGYNPILFLGHQDNKGQVTSDMIHHVEQMDGVVFEVLKKMRKLYEDLVRKLFSLQANDSKNGPTAAEDSAAEAVASSSSASCHTPPSSSSSCHTTPCVSSCASLPSVSTAPQCITPPSRKQFYIDGFKEAVLDKIMSPPSEDDGIIIRETKNRCLYVTQTPEMSRVLMKNCAKRAISSACP